MLAAFADPCPSVAVLGRPHIHYAPGDNRPCFIIIPATPALPLILITKFNANLLIELTLKLTLITHVKVHFLLGAFADPCPSIAVLRRPHIPFAPRDNRPRFIIITATPALGCLCRRRRRRCRRRISGLLFIRQTTAVAAVTGRTGSI